MDELNLELTNELQLLEFQLSHEIFGINIAKVSEIIRYTEITPMPSAPPQVEGVFMHRDKLVTVIDLHTVLNLPLEEDKYGSGLFIMCDFEKMSVAFHVSSVNGIQKLSWAQIETPPSLANTEKDGLATGVVKTEGKIMLVLDFEKIICDYTTGNEFQVHQLDNISVKRGFDFSRGIVLAEDSPFLNKMVVEALQKLGFSKIFTYYNGLDAWDFIRAQKGKPDRDQYCAAVITDIEMPQMDGHSLIRMIKADKDLSAMPVFIFSSLIHENIRSAGQSAGALGQYSRSELNELITDLIDALS